MVLAGLLVGTDVCAGIEVAIFQSTAKTAQKANATKTNDQAASIRAPFTTQDSATTGVAGIAVKLVRAEAVEPEQTASTDEHGAYEFTNLVPGKYTITISLTGFKPAKKQVLLSDKQQDVEDFSLQLDVVSEKVEVNETATAVSTESAAAPPATVTNVELKSIPTPQEKVKDILPITPGVIKTLDSKLTFKGSDENQSLLLVNSARTTDPVTGSFGVPIPTDAVESFAVYKTPYDASLGSFSGGLTTIETKPPGDQWSFKLRGVIPSVLGKNGSMVGIAEAVPGVAFDIPIVKHKLLLSEVFLYDMKKTTVEDWWP
jgi:hypothetical protein